MNISALYRILFLVAASLPLSACNDDNDGDNGEPDETSGMTAEKYELIDKSIDALVAAGEMQGHGRFVVADQTTMSDMVERYMESDPELQDVTALDSIFPYDFLPWTPEESDRAFAGFYQANLERAAVEVEDLEILGREITLLMHEQYKEYMGEDEYLGWEQFNAEYPDSAGYVRFSNPVIFREAGFALVHFDYRCGPTCGLGAFALLRFEGGQWVFENWYADWAG